MPCEDNRSSSYDLPNLRDKVNELTRMLCKMCRDNPDNIPAEILPWWYNHQKEDAQREKEEAEAERKRQVIREAWDKLTHEERELLGVKKPL